MSFIYLERNSRKVVMYICKYSWLVFRESKMGPLREANWDKHCREWLAISGWWRTLECTLKIK
jgi:hypothetical protein